MTTAVRHVCRRELGKAAETAWSAVLQTRTEVRRQEHRSPSVDSCPGVSPAD